MSNLQLHLINASWSSETTCDWVVDSISANLRHSPLVQYQRANHVALCTHLQRIVEYYTGILVVSIHICTGDIFELRGTSNAPQQYV